MIDFRAPYSRNEYLSFFKNHFLPEDFETHEEKITPTFQPQFIKSVTKIGETHSLELNVYEILHTSENDPRVSISRETFRLLAGYGVKRALVIFVSLKSQNFRLSLVTIDLKWDDGKKVQREYSNPRRYSFFLGPESKTHTPEEYLVKKERVNDFEDLKSRFSIEVVNKEFYTQIAVLFTQMAGGKRQLGRQTIDAGSGYLKLPSTSDDTLRKEFTVRLIGRLVFCWFLKKKYSEKGVPLLPEELLSSTSVLRNKGYYHSVLEPLFFEVLNTRMDERQKKYQSSPWHLIPFLNGGLFTPHDHDFYELGTMGVSKHINTLRVPDEWLKELFETFETYNFTIDENTSVDVELSIEPEMLGRIFENLLAEINPETGETARKATGSYYTPRPIVEYMVDMSLKRFLTNTTKIDEERVTNLLAYAEIEIKLSELEKREILDALDSIKIIDPACGSGAFPMGILQKMLLVLQKADPDSSGWLERKLSKIENKMLQKEIGKKLKTENVSYVHKLGIIQNSIYGVDIQPIAVEISKLRFFLSLIVDERVNDTKENRGIEPLPNLEFKFVCANSLVGLPKQVMVRERDQMTMFEADDEIKLLRDLRDEYLRSYGTEKKRIEKKFQEVQSKMFKHSLNWGGRDSQTLKLSQWNPFSEEPCSWFDPEWMFGAKEGFDIVIANPPYVNIVNLQKETRDLYKKLFYVTKNKVDLYAYFIEKGFELLKNNAILTFIIPQTWKATTSFSKLREIIFKTHVLHEIVDLDFGVFDAIVKPVIVFIANQRVPTYKIAVKKSDFKLMGQIDVQEVLSKPQYELDTESSAEFKAVFQSIEKNSIPLSEVIRFSRGIKTSNDEKFITSSKGKPDSEYHKVFRGKNIKAYRITWGNEYVWYRPDLMRKKEGCLPHSNEFFEVPEKVVTQRVNSSMQLLAAYDNQRRYFLDTVNVSDYTSWKKDVPMKFICALLNSSVINFYYCNKYRMPTIGGYELHSIPIKLGTDVVRAKIVTLVDKILSIDGADEKKRVDLIDKINAIVFDLYSLTKREIEVIQKSQALIASED